ncbi:EamA family transporter [Leucobacter viscericola]|uniref:EamA family transporter n=2 Tax=Leucobacter viscericola TaxID=2714935 RepID=A0A6G7XFF6_9MICO|nr:EamA family transporter [Leucobacter viscericola]
MNARISGMLFAVSSSVSNQVGAGMGALVFPAIGPLGVVAVRQFVTAIVFVCLARPKWRQLTRRDWAYAGALGVALGAMSAGTYGAINQIGLGLAVTIEFLGPLGVAIAMLRRRIDLFAIVAALVGVVLLVQPGPTSNYLGVAYAGIGALGWASYILLNRTLGARLNGLEGPAVASVVSAVLWIPVAVFWFTAHPPPLWAIGVAMVCAIFSSLLPFASDLAALRRVSAGIFGILTSLNPVWAALIGWLVLGQLLEPLEWTGLALVVGSNALVMATSSRR